MYIQYNPELYYLVFAEILYIYISKIFVVNVFIVLVFAAWRWRDTC